MRTAPPRTAAEARLLIATRLRARFPGNPVVVPDRELADFGPGYFAGWAVPADELRAAVLELAAEWERSERPDEVAP